MRDANKMKFYNENNFIELEYAYCSNNYSKTYGVDAISLYVKYKDLSVMKIFSPYHDKSYCYMIELDNNNNWEYIFGRIPLNMDIDVEYIFCQVEELYGMSIDEFSFGHINHEH